MTRKITMVMLISMLMCGQCLAQGFMDSILGPGGIGLYGASNTGQFNYQQYQNGSMYPAAAQQSMQQPGYDQSGGYPPQQYGYQPPPPYGAQQGLYSDWHVNQPQGPQGPPPVQYSAPAPQPGYAPQPMAQQQAYSQPASQPRSEQYSPSYPQPQGFDENLPAGAVRITTTTPDGTIVQYYPPSGDQEEQQVNQPSQRRQKPRTAARPATPKPKQQASEQPQVSAPSQAGGSIAMPRPVEIPKEEDPRAGWGAAVNRVPSAPQAR